MLPVNRNRSCESHQLPQLSQRHLAKIPPSTVAPADQNRSSKLDRGLPRPGVPDDGERLIRTAVKLTPLRQYDEFEFPVPILS
jgi:hypothetical protein